MTDEQLQRIHDIEYSCDSREELAERIVGLENESATLVIKLNAEHIARQNVEAENAKLRELVRRYVEYTSQDCEGCVVKSRCNDGEVDECWQLTEIRGLARELGIEVE